MKFDDLGLQAALTKAAALVGWTQPTPVQASAIPAVLAGRDVLGIAQTGSGKTGAYLLPLFQLLTPTPGSRGPQVLVLVPTRELAAQVLEVMQKLLPALPQTCKAVAAFGGVSINPQMLALRGGVQILVATPGRLLDLVSKNALKLDGVQTLVLDEADKMLDLGFQDELGQILGLLPARRRNLLFSATFSSALKNVAAAFLRQPTVIGLEAQPKAADLIEQRVYKVAPHQKGVLLRHLILDGDWTQVLVFASSKRTADNLTNKLTKNGIPALALHGDKSQGARTTVLADFKRGKLKVLVATDLAARGLDIVNLPHVVNYELPRSPDDYVHRIGRTGRAGQPGVAVTLLTPEEFGHMRVIQKRMQTRLVWESYPGFELPEVRPTPPGSTAGPALAPEPTDP